MIDKSIEQGIAHSRLLIFTRSLAILIVPSEDALETGSNFKVSPLSYCTLPIKFIFSGPPKTRSLVAQNPLHHSRYATDRGPSQTVRKTLCKMQPGRKPNLPCLRISGTNIHSRVSGKTKKLDTKREKLMFVK